MLALEHLPSFYWICAISLLGYFAWDHVVTKRLARKAKEHPIVDSPWWASRVFLNLIFASKATKVLENGYNKFKDRAFRLIRGDGVLVILPLSEIEELSALPSSVASSHGALEQDLLGPYTGLNIILDSRMHQTIVQRKLTPRLSILTPPLQQELTTAFAEFFPACDEWKEVQPYNIMSKVAARLSARAMVGPELCRDPVWLDVSVNYTENLFRTIVLLRIFPSWMHPFISRLLPSYWAGHKHLKAAKSLLGPKFQDLLRKNDAGTWSPGNKEEDFNVISWLVDAAKGRDRDPDTLAHIEVLLALASVHTTLLRMVNALYDITANPGYVDQLRAEIQGVWNTTGWEGSLSTYNKLHKLDSVLRESQRISPPTVLGMKRLFKKPHTFASGLHIPKGTYVALPTLAIENDPEHTADPETFDGLRSYRRLVEENPENMVSKQGSELHQFSSIEKTVLNFGYGKLACPGRHFASLIIKMVFVKLLTEYDFKFPEGTGRPQNYMVHEFLFPWPWDKILVKRKDNGSCPF